ncbi:hypothetical protein D3C80_2184390 [compost metagenome]
MHQEAALVGAARRAPFGIQAVTAREGILAQLGAAGRRAGLRHPRLDAGGVQAGSQRLPDFGEQRLGVL